jgi:hypothetical protein
MRTKINIISWVVFLVLLSHMTQEKSVAKKESDNYRIHHEQKIALRKIIQSRNGS